MTGEQFLLFAEGLLASQLSNDSPDEAAVRSAISRAYYGAFHLASAFLTELGFEVGDRHSTVWRHLQVSNTASASLAGHKLNSLYQSRRRADYELANRRACEVSFAKRCVEEAREIAHLIVECSGMREEVRSGITASLTRFGGRLP